MSVALDLLIAELQAYYTRESRIAQGVALHVHGVSSPDVKERLRPVLHKHIRLKEEAAQAIRSLQYLRDAGFPVHARSWVGPEAGADVMEVLANMLEGQAAIDTRSTAVRAELVAVP